MEFGTYPTVNMAEVEARRGAPVLRCGPKGRNH
jgi:hypothetical protein